MEGPFRLRYSHLQAALCNKLVEHLAALATFVSSSHVLAQVFWAKHINERKQTSVGAKGEASGVYWRPLQSDRFHVLPHDTTRNCQATPALGQSESGGVEIMAPTATLSFEKVPTVLSYDRASAPGPSQHTRRYRLANDPPCSKRVRSRTLEAPVCTTWRRVGRNAICVQSTAKLQLELSLLHFRLTQDTERAQA